MLMRMIRVLLLLSLLSACSSAGDPADATCGSAELVVDVSTSDDLILAADYHPAADAGLGALVLLHMIPPDNDRSGFNPTARLTLRDAGWSVLNLDRRGAGGSEGAANEAYQGTGGRLDVEAAVSFLTDPERVCAVDPGRIVVVGASNGTTSALDYAAAHYASLPAAAGQIWLSPGEYTENQHAVGDHIDALGPLLWLYPSTEPWADVFRSSPAAGWTFERIGAVHGTRMFDEEPLRSEALLAMTSWLSDL
jgi:pimeloyl-ACP methyl ester carboxylesterase